MKCTNCGQECKEGSLFCSNCGAKLITEDMSVGETDLMGDNKVETVDDDNVFVDKILDDTSDTTNKSDVLLEEKNNDTNCFVEETIATNDVTLEEETIVPNDANLDLNQTTAVEEGETPAIIVEDEKPNEKRLTKKEERQKIAHQKVNAKSDARFQKKVDKYQKRQDMINACPLPFRPIPFAQYFWLNFLTIIPVVGLIVAFFGSICPKNQNIKNLERSYLLWHLILLIIIGILSVYAFVNYGDSSMREALSQIMGAFHK